VVVLQNHQKGDQLLSLLTRINTTEGADPARVPKTLVFVSRRSDCDSLADALYEEGYAVDSLHGDKAQGLRDR
jgi:superfamily II DNA/RNA helicase